MQSKRAFLYIDDVKISFKKNHDQINLSNCVDLAQLFIFKTKNPHFFKVKVVSGKGSRKKSFFKICLLLLLPVALLPQMVRERKELQKQVPEKPFVQHLLLQE